MKNLIFNPKYILKKDEGSVLLLPKSTFNIDDDIEGGTMYKIHPIHAAILSFFNGRKEEEAIKEASNFLSVGEHFVKNFTEKIKENEEKIYVGFNGLQIVFPKKILIFSEKVPQENYNPLDFEYENINLGLKRHKTPTDITLMLNNKCATDCIYCYADRRVETNCSIPLGRIFELIEEAKSFGARSFEVIGGEFFLYKHWDRVVEKLHEKNYHPYISTKVPIGEKIVSKLHKLNIKYIQISLDSFNKENIKSILGVKDNYLTNMTKTFDLLEKYGIKVYVHTIMNSKNQNIEDIESLFNFLKNYNNIGYWRLDKAGASLYKGRGVFSYQEFKPDNIKLQKIIKFIIDKEFKSQCNFNIIYEGISEAEVKTGAIRLNSDWNTFFNRSLCTANYSNMFILPDGKVTVCEELYWTERFIIGDALKNSLENIWNSEKAKGLFYLDQTDFPADSPCKTCDMFNDCRLNKGVCYRDVMKAHGIDKWYYPDRKCPKSIEETYEIYV